MTHPHRTPPPPGTGQHHGPPFAALPGRWEREVARALRRGRVRGPACTAGCEPVLIYERTGWGWYAWTIPGDGSPPELPHQVGVLTPRATRRQRLALCWLTRRPARRIGLAGGIPGSLRLSVAVVAVVGLAAGSFALTRGIPVSVVLPAIVLGPLLAGHLPARWDARAREHVHTVEGDDACRCLQRLARWHTHLIAAARGSDRYELRRFAEIGQHLLWDAAGLLQTHDTRVASCALIARERLMLQLADQAAQIHRRTPAPTGPKPKDQPRTPGRPPDPLAGTTADTPGQARRLTPGGSTRHARAPRRCPR
ncbi:hypothetical protein GRC12_38115 [Streptomyces griseorubiginosus]|nr:hypothetical protein [Streptomyces griseorubiginosus]